MSPLLHNAITVSFPFPVIYAQIEAASAASFSWSQTLLVYGPLGLWVAWFVIRDRLDREERKQERIDQERRHQENLAAQRAIETAFRTNTNSIIVGLAATKHMDAAFTDLFNRIGDENKSDDKRTHH